MKHFKGNRLSVRLIAALLALLLVPAAVMAETVEVEDVPGLPNYALPIDFTPGPALKNSAFSQTKDANGNSVHTYEDSTIRATVYTDVYKGPDGSWTHTDIWVADVTISDPSQLRTASFDDNFDFVSTKRAGKIVTLAKRLNAVVAVDGDSWGANSRNEKNGFGVVFRQGKLIKSALDEKGKYKMDLLIVDAWGDFHGIHAAEPGDLDDPYTFEGKKVMDIFSFGPILVENGEAIYDYQGVDREPALGGSWMDMRALKDAQRIALCQIGPLHYLIAASAGQIGGNRGLSMPEFADYLVSKGVQFAYNLDGGVSSVLYFPGAGNNGKVNLKSRAQGRDLWDLVYFATAEK